jgi:outer membrane protein assembly factor BamE (lipoprotein component of BamABCDE complex)
VNDFKELNMKHMMMVLFSVLFMAGCVTEGRDFQNNFAWIKKGTTKQEDVRMVMGAPHRVGNTSGTPTWTYGYYRYKLIGKSLTKEIKFYWNADNTVQSYAFNSSFPDDMRTTTQPAAVPPRD